MTDLTVPTETAELSMPSRSLWQDAWLRLRRNKAALLQAVRILGADPGSTGTLEKVLANDAYSLDARRLAATALSHLAPGPAPGPVRRGSAAAGPAKAKGALATHLDTLRRIRQ